MNNFNKTAAQATKLTAKAALTLQADVKAIWGCETIVAPRPEFDTYALVWIKNGAIAGWY